MSQIKLKHSGGNSVIIAAPDSNPASDRTLKLPSDADGTILSSASTLDATKLSGNLPAISGANLTNIASDCVTLVTRTTATSVSDITFSLDFSTYLRFAVYIALDPTDDGVILNMRMRNGSSDLTDSQYNMRYWGYTAGQVDNQDHFELNRGDAGKYGYEAPKVAFEVTGVPDTSGNTTYGTHVWGAEFHATTTNAKRANGFTGVHFHSGGVSPDGMKIYLDSGTFEKVTYSLVGFKL